MANLTAPATKINHLLALEKITAKDIEGLNQVEREYLAETTTQTLAQLTGVERDNFLDKIDLIIPASTKSEIWQCNHSLINRAVSNYMRKNGVMPAKSDIARETGLSRQTVAKHFAAYKRRPEFTSKMEQFKFMAPNVLANVFKHALNGDMRAARLYFEMVGAPYKQQANTVINEQNNYIQINNTILSQENLKQLSAEQLNQIENIITNNECIEIS
jgi:predicted transcriptional regulator